MRSFDIPENNEDENWRGEPETADVWGQQGEVNWDKQPSSDDSLSSSVKMKLDALKGD